MSEPADMDRGPEDARYIKLGKEVVRMIHDVLNAPNRECAYCRRHLTFPGGEVFLLIASESKLADVMEQAVRTYYDVEDATPRSEVM